MKCFLILLITQVLLVGSGVSLTYDAPPLSEDPTMVQLSRKSLRYMKHLYDDTQNGRNVFPTSANTVRSVIPIKEVDNEGESYLYDVLGDQGSVVFSEIQLQTRRSAKRSTKIEFDLFDSSSEPFVVFLTKDIPTTNITRLVLDAISSGTAIRARRKQLHKGQWRTVKFRNPPGLLIFSNDPNSFSFDDMNLEARSLDGRTKRSASAFRKEEISPTETETGQKNISKIFHLRDFNPIKRGNEDNSPTINNKGIRNKYRKRRKLAKNSKKRKNRNQLIPFPASYKKKSNKKTKKLNKRGKFIPDHFIKTSLNKMSNDVLMFPTDNEVPSVCQKKELFVDFKQLDWNHFIIAPKGFHPNYCSGGCSNPLTKENAGSNHAIIKSVMQQIGQWPTSNPTQCVPDKLSSLSLLLNTSRGIILRTYPKMEIQTCSCR